MCPATMTDAELNAMILTRFPGTPTAEREAIRDGIRRLGGAVASLHRFITASEAKDGTQP